MSSFIEWLSNINLASWDALAAIGQLLGAGATVWTARIALRQVNLANDQIEETRKREEDALKPELEIKIETTLDEFHLLLVNKKLIPVTIYKHDVLHYVPLAVTDEIILNAKFIINENLLLDTPNESVSLGNAFTMKLPIKKLLEKIKSETISSKQKELRHFFECNIYLMTGEMYTVSILFEYKGEKYTIDYWDVYIYPHKATNLKQIKKQDYYVGFFDYESLKQN